MIENPKFDKKRDRFDMEKALEEFIQAGEKADFLMLMYPDKEAVIASNMVDDYVNAIEDGQITIPNIDGHSLLYFLNLEAENSDPVMKKGEREFSKLKLYVSKITGVSVERINEANVFWAKQFFNE